MNTPNPKAPRSPHTSPTTGAIAEELGRTPQSSPRMAQLHAKHTNAYSLLPPLDTKQVFGSERGRDPLFSLAMPVLEFLTHCPADHAVRLRVAKHLLIGRSASVCTQPVQARPS